MCWVSFPPDGRCGTNPLAHDYEEVRGWGPASYEDLQGNSLLPPAALQFHPRAPVSTYHEVSECVNQQAVGSIYKDALLMLNSVTANLKHAFYM